MSAHVQYNGGWGLVASMWCMQPSGWVPIQKAHVMGVGAWAEVFAAEVVVTLAANVNNVNIQSLFTADDWAATKKKRVVVAAGVTVGSTSPAVAAMATGTGRTGLLQIDVLGRIAGAGGVPNSGAGGPALSVLQDGTIINNAGSILGGGGAGGIGGTGGVGGTGSYTATEGPTYSAGTYMWRTNTATSGNTQGLGIFWAGTQYVNHSSQSYISLTSLNEDGVNTWVRGSRYSGNGTSGINYYYVSRQYTAYMGGAGGGGGGNGGYGQGSNQSRTNGLGGAGGGNNGGNSGVGGTGGTGGNGGDWGQPGGAGNTGNTGAAGNAGGGGGGYAGGAGGAAGRAVSGSGYTLNNAGTIAGAY